MEEATNLLKCKCGNKTFYHTWLNGCVCDETTNIIRVVTVEPDEHFWCEKCNKEVKRGDL
jgi:predicted SprT family Zn-dependent metalloprotease